MPMTIDDLKKFPDEKLLTACLWAEARGEPANGQQAVCYVICNRVRKRMAHDIRAVILAKAQFSWTNPADPNFQKVFTADHDFQHDWARAARIAKSALALTLADLTKDADHYLNVELTRKFRGGTLPKWAQDAIDQGRTTVVIGNHTFLKLRG